MLYTPDRELTPPESNDLEIEEKETCPVCLIPSDELFTVGIDVFELKLKKDSKVCSNCLSDIHSEHN